MKPDLASNLSVWRLCQLHSLLTWVPSWLCTPAWWSLKHPSSELINPSAPVSFNGSVRFLAFFWLVVGFLVWWWLSYAMVLFGWVVLLLVYGWDTGPQVSGIITICLMKQTFKVLLPIFIPLWTCMILFYFLKSTDRKTIACAHEVLIFVFCF